MGATSGSALGLCSSRFESTGCYGYFWIQIPCTSGSKFGGLFASRSKMVPMSTSGSKFCPLLEPKFGLLATSTIFPMTTSVLKLRVLLAPDVGWLSTCGSKIVAMTTSGFNLHVLLDANLSGQRPLCYTFRRAVAADTRYGLPSGLEALRAVTRPRLFFLLDPFSHGLSVS